MEIKQKIEAAGRNAVAFKNKGFHCRFIQEFGERECNPLRDKWIPVWPEGTCERVYKRGAEIAVELVLTASDLVSECQQKV